MVSLVCSRSSDIPRGTLKSALWGCLKMLKPRFIDSSLRSHAHCPIHYNISNGLKVWYKISPTNKSYPLYCVQKHKLRRATNGTMHVLQGRLVLSAPSASLNWQLTQPLRHSHCTEWLQGRGSLCGSDWSCPAARNKSPKTKKEETRSMKRNSI